MDLRLATTNWTAVEADWLIVGVTEPPEIGGRLAELDQALGGVITRLKDAGDLTGKPNNTLPLRGVTGIATPRVLLVGLGQPQEVTVARLDKSLTTTARQISDKPNVRVAVALPELPSISMERGIESAAVALQVGSQGQDLYRTERARHPFAGGQILIQNPDGKPVEQALQRGVILGEAVNLTRELVNRPPGEIYPASFAERARQLAEQYGLGCEIWDEDRLRQERMNALLAVAQGSTQPPRMVRLEYRGAGENAPTLALVGKGVTFDSGGLSIKPTDGMLTMKCDMAGAATVLSAMTAIARLNLPVNVQGFMGLVENMPGGSAFKLGDILKARNGVTIEVLNTDAEGRLVLADVLSYAADLGVDRFIDLATLTGACVVALGEDVVGAFTNNQDWCDRVLAAAKRTGEDAWQLPMFDLYDELIKGDVGDIKNTGGRWGGAITAAKFLQRFVGDKPWVHLDIAGPAFASGNKPHREGGGTGVMVRTLVEVAEHAI